jgi:hypothetical protein
LGLKVEFAKGEIFCMESKGDFLVACGDDRGFEVGLAFQPATPVVARTSDAEAVRRNWVMLL